MKFQNQVLTLHSDAVADDTLMVAKLTGDERLSGLFRFELDLICEDAELNLEAVLYAPVRLGIKISIPLGGGKVANSEREVAGIFESFTQSEQGQGWVKYRAVMVPKLWQTTRSHRSRIFQAQTLQDMATAVLDGDGLDPRIDFEFQLTREGADEDPKTRAVYPEREYVVQYEESDWTFLARWLEHEGIYFYFANDNGEEKVVFADTESAYAKLPVNSYPYHPEASGEGAESEGSKDEEVRTFHCTATRLPTKVTVNDYNWRVPSARLLYSEDVREDGTGLQTEYNDHFKDEAQGKALAKVRKQELACRAKVFHGSGSCRSFRPGATFALDGHFRDDFNRPYLLTTVHHEAEQMISLESATITGFQYENSFTAIPDDMPWRPERKTDWPAIKGVMHARIDAEGEGKYAELDEHGRYKLVLPFDEYADDAEPGKASRWVRMSQPYAGQNAGMHFPLLKGTEVLLTHIDGDPDRPVISGAVPNPETESPASGDTSTRNAIQTASGNTMQIDDNEDAPGFVFTDSTGSFVSDIRRHRAAGAIGAGGGTDLPAGGSGSVTPSVINERDSTRAPTRSDEPCSGKGMTDENSKQAAWNSGLGAAWRQFANGAAVTDIRDNGRYQGDADAGLGLSSFNGSSEGGVTGPVKDSTDGLDKAGLETIVKYLATVVTKLGEGDDWTSKEFSRGSGKRVSMSTFLDGVHNFTGEAFGSRLRNWIGDDWMVRVGDRYTYADISNDVSIGTGGNSWAEEHGDTSDWSRHWGDSTGYSKKEGNDSSTSITMGDTSGFSYRYGTDTSNSITFGSGATFSLNGTARSDTSVVLGAVNENSVFIGAKATFDMEIAAKLELFINATGTFKIGISSTQTWCNLGSKFQIECPDSTKVALRDTLACLQKNDGMLQEMNAVLQGSRAALTQSDAAIKEDKNALQKTGSALSSVGNAISEKWNAINWSTAAVAIQQQTAAASTMAGVVTM